MWLQLPMANACPADNVVSSSQRDHATQALVEGCAFGGYPSSGRKDKGGESSLAKPARPIAISPYKIGWLSEAMRMRAYVINCPIDSLCVR